MKIYISDSHKNHGIVADLAGILEKHGHYVISEDKMRPGVDWAKYLAEELAKADVVIIALSCEHQSSLVLRESYVANTRLLTSKDGRPLLIPILLGTGSNNVLPPDFEGMPYYWIEGPHQVTQVSEAILFAINAFAAKQQKEATEAKDSQDRIESGKKQYIDEIISKLEKTAKKQKILAGILYAISAIMLLLTIGIAILFLANADLSSASLEKVAVIGVVYLFVAILVVSFSKFLFTLAKSFMVEAIRCTDRVHAISFGLYYISAFDEKVTRDEVMKIFSNWNIDNGATLFRNQTSEDFDPKIHELFGLFKKTGS